MCFKNMTNMTLDGYKYGKIKMNIKLIMFTKITCFNHATIQYDRKKC